jgi:uncharacterized protein (AIM24 family)
VKSGTTLIAQSGAYMSELGDVNVGCSLDCSYRTCCCAGLGCCRQKITASDGSIAFLAAGGTVIYRHLEDGETVTVDTNSVVAYEESVTMGITPNGRLFTCCFGGEGCFSTTLTGPGRIYMQVSMALLNILLVFFQPFLIKPCFRAMDSRDFKPLCSKL